MIPIDGEKLTKPSEEDIRGGWTLNTDIMSEIEKIGDDVWEEFNPCLEGVEVVLISLLKCKSLQFKPGTLIIQREEGYEERGCESCISLYHGEIYGEPDCKIIRDSSRVYDDWVDGTKHEPCKYHITEDELKVAYIVGGGESG